MQLRFDALIQNITGALATAGKRACIRERQRDMFESEQACD